MNIWQLIVLLVVFLAVVSGCTVFFMRVEERCTPENQMQINGFFQGFSENKTFFDVYINNQSYLFYRFNSDYMQRLIGFNISLCCCKCFDDVFIVDHYDLIEARIV